MRCGVICLREGEQMKNGLMVYKNMSRLKIQRLFSWVRGREKGWGRENEWMNKEMKYKKNQEISDSTLLHSSSLILRV